jgi:biopolymer transport protein TolR
MSMNVGKKGVNSNINITPYIDILLVMLIIFMVAVPLKLHDHPVRVPEPPPKVQPETKPDSIIVEMDLDHSIKLNNAPYTMDKLEPLLTEIMRRRAIKALFIRGDAALPYGAIFPLLDLAKRSGATDIALLQKKDGQNISADASQGGH